MKKTVICIVAAIVVVAGVYIFGSGFTRATSVYINSYSVSEDGTEMTVNISVASSAGFVRKATVSQHQGGKIYIDCYSAFGGLNGSIGAKSTYTIQLSPEDEIIALYRGPNCYEEVLHKDSNGVWER